MLRQTRTYTRYFGTDITDILDEAIPRAILSLEERKQSISQHHVEHMEDMIAGLRLIRMFMASEVIG